MIKKIKLLLILIALFYAESVILSRFPWDGTVLPLTFAAGAAIAIVSDEWDAIFAALTVGFFADLYTNHLFGINMLLNLYTFLGLFWIKAHLRQEKNWLMALVMAAAAFIRYGLHFALNLFTGLPQTFAPVPRLTVLVLLAGMPLLILIRRLFRSKLVTSRI